MFVLFLINVALFIAAELLRPKPDLEDAEAIPYEEANFPQIDPTRKIPVALGAVRLTAPHVADVSNYATIPIKQKVRTSLFSSKKQIIAHRYFVGMMLAFCHGPATMKKIYWDDEEVWSGTAAPNDNGVSVAIDLPDLFGGKEKGGGLIGVFTWFGGTLTQNQSSYLATYQSLGIAYRGTAYLVLEDVEVGEAPNLSPLAIEVEAYPNPLALTTTEKIGRDMNAMNIGAEIFVNDDWGFGLNISAVETVSWIASAQTLFDESNGMSLKLAKEQKLDKTLVTIAKQVDGQHRYRSELTQWDYKLMREDYVVGNLPVFGVDVVKQERNFKRVNWEELTSLVSVNFSNRDSKNKPSPAEAHDRSLFDRLGGRNNPASYSFPGVYDKSNANRIANRQLQKFAFPFASVDLVVDRSGYDLLPGQPIVWQSPDRGIDQLVMRITKISLGTIDQPNITISCVEDVFGQANALFSDPPTSLYTPVAGVPVQVTNARAYDQFYYAAIFDEDRTDQAAPVDDKPLLVAEQPQGNALEYRIESREDADPYQSQATAEYAPVGTVQGSFEISETNIDEITTLIVENVTAAAKLDDYLSATDQEIQELFANLIIIDNGVDEPEICAYESMSRVGSTVTLTNVHRGLIDTMPLELIDDGDVVWFISADSLGSTFSQYANDADVDHLLYNVATTGEATVGFSRNNVFRNRVNRPYPGGNLEINTLRWPSEIFAVNSDFDIRWKHRDRTGSTISYSDEGPNGGVTDLETGFEWKLEIYDDVSNSLLRTIQGREVVDGFTSVSTTTVQYDYTNALQITDGGPFARYRIDLAVVDEATGLIEQLVSQIRIFSVVVPVNFHKRGNLYWQAALAPAGSRWNFAVDEATFTEQIGGSDTSTDRGTIARGVPGYNPLTKSIHIPGREPDGTVDWQGNLEVPYNQNLNLGRDNGSTWFAMKFKMVADGQTDKRILVAQENTANPDSILAWRILLNSTGKQPEIQIRTVNMQTAIAYDKTWDDGRWHTLYMNKFEEGSGKAVCMIDGCVFYTGVVTTGSQNTLPLSIGGYDDADLGSEPHGWAKMFFALVQGNDAYAPPYNNGVGATGNDAFQQAMKMLIDDMDWTPFQIAGKIAFDHVWVRAPWSMINSQDKFVLNWAGVGNMIDESATALMSFTDQIAIVGGGGFTQTTDIKEGHLLDGSLTTAQVIRSGFSGGNQIRPSRDFYEGGIGVSASADGPATMTLFAVFNPDDLTQEIPLYHSLSDNTAANRNFGIWVDTDGKIYSYKRDSSASDYRRQATDNQCIFGGRENVVFVIVGRTGGMKVRVNGEEFSVDTADLTSGTPPGIDEWMDNRSWTGGQMAHGGVFQWHTNSVPVGAAGAFGDNWLGFASEYATTLRELTDDQMILIEAAMYGPVDTLRDIFLDFNPENTLIVEDNTAADLRGRMGSPTASGTFTADEEVPSGMDDTSKPQRFSGAQDLVYTTHMLDSKGTGVFDNFSFALVGMVADITAAMSFALSENVTPDTNFKIQTDGVSRLRFAGTGQTAVDGPTIANYQPFCAVMTHEDDAGTDRWNWWNEGTRAQSELTTARAYSGGAVTDARLGETQGGGSQDLDGYVGYLSTYARTIPPRLARRLNLRWMGYRGALLWAHQFIKRNSYAGDARGFIFPLADLDTSASGAENFIGNDQGGSVVNMIGTATAIKEYAGATLPAFQQITTGNALTGQFETTNAVEYPMNFGVVLRVDSGTEAWASIWSPNPSGDEISIGIVSGEVRLKTIINGATAVNEDSTGLSIPVGSFVVASIAVLSDTDRRLYINGKLHATFTASINWDSNAITQLDSCGVNVTNIGGTKTYNGSYQMFWCGFDDMDDADHFRMHAEQMAIAWRQVTHRFGPPISQHLLDEPTSMVTDVYRDRFNDDYAAAPTSTGVTQAVEGILPNRRDPCVEFDGANGGIDTVWSGYVIGAAERVIECWIEPGYVGTVVSMGANVDAQALVISIDGNGDVVISIRGTGNERIWQSDLDAAGTDGRHLAIELPAAGDSLYDFDVFVDGVEETTITTAGTDTTLNTVATLDMHIGEDVTDLAKADGNGKLYGVTVYDVEIGSAGIAFLEAAGQALPENFSW